MLFFVLIIGLGIAFSYEGWQDWRDDGFEVCLLFILGCAIGLLICLIITLVVAEFGNYYDLCKHNIKTEYIEIVSLQPFNSVEGSFVLGTGTIDGKMYYIYMKKESGGYRKGKILADDVLICETNEVSPRLSWKVLDRKVPTWLWPEFIIPIFDDFFKSPRDFVMYVPKGTIIKEFRV